MENPSTDTILPDMTKTQGIYIRWARINLYLHRREVTETKNMIVCNQTSTDGIIENHM